MTWTMALESRITLQTTTEKPTNKFAFKDAMKNEPNLANGSQDSSSLTTSDSFSKKRVSKMRLPFARSSALGGYFRTSAHCELACNTD
eukprot:4292263-Amphidinium_carterae.1